MANKAKDKFSAAVGEKMLNFFTTYDEGGAPSMIKFALKMGMRLFELEELRDDEQFDRIYRECGEIRRDYLIDRALERRYDPSLVKHLISAADEKESGGAHQMRLKLTVTE